MFLSKERSRSKRQPDEYGKFIRSIRQCVCIIPGCGKEAEPAHLRLSSAKHKKLNGRDHRWINPLCPEHHRLGPDSQHSTGEEIWWSRQGIDPLETAILFWQARNDLEAMQRIEAVTIRDSDQLK